MKKYGFLVLSLLIVSSEGCATVPRATPVTSLPPAPHGMTHVVGGGDTLWRIAKEYGVAIQDILRTNQLTDPNRIAVGQRLIIPEAEVSIYREPSYPPVPLDFSIEKRVGPRHPHSDWRYITMHHSATRQGSAKPFDRTHRRRKMGGLFYHFVIGNGTGSGDGEVEVGWRWRKQADVNRPHDIQVCLVGDFSRQRVSEAQFESLVNLIRILQKHYDIPTNHVRRHKDIRGKSTECPGNRFPFYKLLTELRRTGS